MHLAEREKIGVDFLDVKIAPGRGSRGTVDSIIAAQRRSARVVGADVGTLGVAGRGSGPRGYVRHSDNKVVRFDN